MIISLSLTLSLPLSHAHSHAQVSSLEAVLAKYKDGLKLAKEKIIQLQSEKVRFK